MLTLKKTLSLVLAALLITALLAACGGGTPARRLPAAQPPQLPRRVILPLPPLLQTTKQCTP